MYNEEQEKASASIGTKPDPKKIQLSIRYGTRNERNEIGKQVRKDRS
jgi:hypothetical protein